jgi:hypothetical protein
VIYRRLCHTSNCLSVYSTGLPLVINFMRHNIESIDARAAHELQAPGVIARSTLLLEHLCQGRGCLL